MEINNPRGILLMALGMALFAVADTIAKVLLEHYPPAQVVFLRQLGLFFGVNFIMFYNLKWVDDRMHKIFSIWSRKSRICMKVNPNQPFASGIRLEWFDRWTTGLMNHYAEIYNCYVDEFREAEDGRFKWDYITR